MRRARIYAMIVAWALRCHSGRQAHEISFRVGAGLPFKVGDVRVA